MSLADEFQPDAIAHQLTTDALGTLSASGLPQADVEASANLLYHFAKIAGDQILMEPGLQAPDTDAVVPYTPALAHQCVELFFHGALHATLKCWEYGIQGEQKTFLLQQLANEVFQQTKQMVISTLGQELTPEIQFSKEQQIEWIKQSAESALIYFINEMEKNKPETPQAQEAIPMQATQAEPEVPPPPVVEQNLPAGEGSSQQPPPPPASVPHPSPPQIPPPVMPPATAVKLSAPLEKYAAVSMFLTLLRTTQKAAMLQQFSDEERKVIARYQENPDLIVSELNVVDVEQHLLSFHERFQLALKEDEPEEFSAHAELLEALQTLPASAVMKLLRQERPGLQSYVAMLLKDPQRSHRQTLPPGVDETLSRYLRKRLEASSA